MKQFLYNVPIYLSEGFTNTNAEFIINGIAISATLTDNGHMFIADELRNAASTLINRPLLKDHNYTVDSVVGKVLKAEYSESEKAIKFQARVNNSENGKKMQELILSGDLNTVSIGAQVNEVVEEDGYLVPKGLKFKELSLVATPADDNATFTKSNFQMILQEMFMREKIHCPECDKIFKSKEEMDKHVEDEHEEMKKNENSQSSMGASATQNDNQKVIIKTEESMEKDENSVPEVAEETKSNESNVLKEQVNAQAKILSEILDKLGKLEKTEIKPAVPIKESKPEKVEESEDTEEDWSDDVEEKGNYKLVQGHRFFTIVKNKY